MTRPKVPRTPPETLTAQRSDFVLFDRELWRVHRTAGSHVVPWNVLREYGPLAQCRWDPHPEPAGTHPGCGVAYASADLRTALAEVFQTTRTIDTTTDQPFATAWRPRRPLRLLDLTGTWPIRNGASAALMSADRSVCRAWARGIRTAWPELDGLLTHSTMTSGECVTLFAPSSDSFSSLPAFTRPLAYPLVWSIVRAAADSVGYRVV